MRTLRLLAALILLGLATSAAAQSGPSNPPIQFQNAGTPLGVSFIFNCSTGTTCTITNGVLIITASGGGSGCTTSGSAGQLLSDNGAGGCTSNADFVITSHTLAMGASGILDLHLASVTAGFKLPTAAGAAPVTDGICAVNTTTHLLVCGFNGASTITLPVTKAAVTSNFLTSYTQTTGAFTAAQPAFTDISGSLACSQMPALTGDTTTSAGACATTTSKINGTAFAGTSGDVVSFGASNTPADSGVVAANLVTNSSNFTVDGILYGTGNHTVASTAAGTSGQVLTSNGAGVAPTYQTPTTGFANPMTTLGDVIYENATPAAARLAGCALQVGVPCIMTETPTSGPTAAAPVWAVAGVPFDAQTGTSYTIANTDRESLVTTSNGSAIAITLPQAASNFASNFTFALANIGAGLVTITPTTSTINGNATQIVPNHWISYIYGDNTNYRAGTFADIAAYPNCANPLSFTSATGVFNCLSGTSGGIPYFSAANTWASSGALTASAIVLGGGAGASPTVLGSLGTTTTVLHGNAAGAPTFGAVVSADMNITTTTCTAPQVLTAISATGTGTCATIPVTQNSQSAAYTTVLGDAGKQIYHPGADTTARTWTIDSNANVAYPIGTVITFINDTSGGVITIAITSDTLVLAGAGSTGSRTLAASGIATAIKMTSTRWMINGTGLT